ncbi:MULTISPECIES: hypothetical protein [Variovorax]|mgnify:CR=1 FL=1|jgi:hypothetical protein|uniref:Uncharacterized protein n=1 Tax=Variovorax paradoxus TaxID=34073 RepID=A0AAW8EGJ3_VARPD|nr:hypothetical protein [Variovorax paradoxus]MDP9971923.1 hypothetical protein [Variovorax paradoxus]
MAFNLTKAQEKRFTLLQQKNFQELFLDSDSIIDLIQFPESSILLEKIKNITKFKDGTEVQGTAHLFEHLFDFAANQSDACLLILPGLSPQSGFIYTQYPAIKAEAAQLHLLLESMRKRLTQVDYLALVSEKLKYGVVLDVYAGNPEIHGTNKEICQITTW